MKDELVQIRITKNTKLKLEALANRLGLKQITVLEYLLKGKIKLKELK